MHPSTPTPSLFPARPSFSSLPGSCEERKLRKSVAEKAIHSEVALMDMLRENKIPDANIFIYQRDCPQIVWIIGNAHSSCCISFISFSSSHTLGHT